MGQREGLDALDSQADRKAISESQPSAGNDHRCFPVPCWDRRTGELRWHGDVILRLSDRASMEAAILDEFQRLGWNWVILDPIGREVIGDPSLSRRHAVLRLNLNQRSRIAVRFASLHGGFVCWWPAEWTSQ